MDRRSSKKVSRESFSIKNGLKKLQRSITGNKIQFKIIKSKNELESGDILIIVDSSVEKKDKVYTELKLICSKIFLIHLGDEAGLYDLSSIYNNCDYVWRTFCSNKYFKNSKIKCIPLGYKSGVSDKSVKKKKIQIYKTIE